MPSYPAKSSVPDIFLSYEKGGDKLLSGVRNVETLREADLCWNVAQFYAIAIKSTSTLQQTIQVIRTFEDLFNQRASQTASQDEALYKTLRDLRKQREGLEVIIQGLHNGVETVVEDFQQAQGIEDDCEMEITESVTLEYVGSGDDVDSEKAANGRTVDLMEVDGGWDAGAK